MFKKIRTAIVFLMTLAFAAGLHSLFAVDDYDDEDEGKAAVAATDVYKLSMTLHVPRIYNNEKSQGTRKYQTQRVSGEALFQYDKDGKLVDVKFRDMVNKTYKLSNGKNLTYPRAVIDTLIYPRFNAIGSNKTGVFKTASIGFYLAAEPSYNIGQFDEDNALYIMLSGKGSFHSSKGYLKSASGYAAGTLGCGCMAYGHVSPTRRIGYYGPTDEVDDVAAVYGTWKLQYSGPRK